MSKRIGIDRAEVFKIELRLLMNDYSDYLFAEDDRIEDEYTNFNKNLEEFINKYAPHGEVVDFIKVGEL